MMFCAHSSSHVDSVSLTEKDVTRTDRGEAFFAGSPNITLLHDILVTYCMYNFDLGYVQVGHY